MNYQKIGLAVSTILLVGAAGASISGLFSRVPITTAVVDKVSSIDAEGKMVVNKLTVSRITVTPSDAVLLDAEIGSDSVNYTISALDELSKNRKEIYLLINSPGGSVIDGARLNAYIESSPVKINTVCISLCASMAAHIHQTGYKRLVQDKSILMFHPASGGARGTMNEMLTLLRMLDTYTSRMDAYAANRSGIPYAEFKNRVLNNFWVEGEDAMKMRLADGMVYMVLKANDVPAMSVNQKLGGKGGIKKVNSIYGDLYDLR